MVMRATKKPVTIEFEEFTGDNLIAITAFCGDQMFIDNDGVLWIRSIEGDHRANVGNMIIKGVKGEFYAIKPDIFAETYNVIPVKS